MMHAPIIRNCIGAILLCILLMFNTIALISLGLTICQGSTPTQFTKQSADGFVLPDSSARLYTESEVQQLNDREVVIAINEIYARHGLTFNDPDLANYFESKSWYIPSRSFEDFENNSPFNAIEQQNIVTLATERDRRNL